MRAHVLVCLALVGCGAPEDLDAGIDAGRDATDAPLADVPGLDVPAAVDGGSDAGPDGVPVSHARELRAVWVATVSRLDYPSAVGLTLALARSELSRIVDTAVAAGLNAIFFQVRPESDAFWDSAIEPWSRFLTGTQGRDPGYDPLAILIELARPRGIEVHAWVNPLRGMTSTTAPTDPSHVTRELSDAAITYNGAITMDPADSRVRQRVVDVVVELVRNYDLDGVVFDDYFYPYPDSSGTPFPDSGSYDAYRAGGGTLSLRDFRRDNVNQLVQAVSEAIEAEEPWVRFGISPFGIYRPGMPPGVVGLDAYDVIACDTLAWIAGEWVDYVAPQLYWPTTSTGQPFGDLIAWWATQGSEERPIVATLGPYRLGSSSAWSVDELALQVDLSRAEGSAVAGHSWFRYANIASNAALRARMAELYATPARPPRVPGMAGATLAAPTLGLAAGVLSFAHPRLTELSGFMVYAGAPLSPIVFVARGEVSPALPTGAYAVSAIDRAGVESLAATIDIP